jgi:hypothetical protein
MGGFPTRTNRTALGGTYEDYKPVTDALREISASTYNLNFWQVAGLSQSAPIGWLLCTVSGAAVTTAEQALAWDPDGGLAPLTWTYKATGVYEFEFAQQYPDQRGVDINLVLRGAVALPVRAKGTARSGSHTGADNQSILTDSTQNWTVNELVGYRIFNIDDGSAANITANTADTVTASLAGGTDNDWDTDDEYIIVEQNPVLADVQLTSDYAGLIAFRASGSLTDPDAFLLLLF